MYRGTASGTAGLVRLRLLASGGRRLSDSSASRAMACGCALAGHHEGLARGEGRRGWLATDLVRLHPQFASGTRLAVKAGEAVARCESPCACSRGRGTAPGTLRRPRPLRCSAWEKLAEKGLGTRRRSRRPAAPAQAAREATFTIAAWGEPPATMAGNTARVSAMRGILVQAQHRQLSCPGRFLRKSTEGGEARVVDRAGLPGPRWRDVLHHGGQPRHCVATGRRTALPLRSTADPARSARASRRSPTPAPRG